MMHNYLAFVDSHDEGKKHPSHVLVKDFGFPDVDKAKKNLFKFFQENQRFIYAFQSELEPESIEHKTLATVIQHFYNNFGPWSDNLEGIQNLFKNLPSLTESSLIFKATNPGKAFIIGAGPSLELSIETLKKVKKEELGSIIAVDAAFKRLMAEGIKPDMVITSERVNECEEFFNSIQKENTHGITFVINAISHPGTVNLVRSVGHKIAFYVRKAEEYEWLGLPQPLLKSTPYVTYAATSLAVSLGFKEVIFVGQDFAHGPNGESHANLLVSEELKGAMKKSGNMLSAESVKSTDEAYVECPTTRILDMFASELESLIEENPRVSFINTSPFGRRIKGTFERNLSGIGYIPQPKAEFVLHPFPLTLKSLKRKAKAALAEFEENPAIHPQDLEGKFKHIHLLAYHFLIQPFVLFQGMAYSDPEKMGEHLALFNQTYGKAREDIMAVLKEFINAK